MLTNPYLRPRNDSPPVLALGCMNFGARTPEPDAVRIIDRALDAGIGLLDTANMYNDGESERVVGRALRGRKGDVLVASKVGLHIRDGRQEGLSRETVLMACDESLRHLQMDTIDLYYLHAPDPETPIEETLAAVGSLLEAGKIRQWAVSNYASWQILELRHLAASAGMPMPLVAQQMYNPLIHQLDIEYFAYAARYPIHTSVYNPLAGGLLTGLHKAGAPPAAGSRFDGNAKYQRRFWSPALFAAADALADIARDEGMDMVTLAYAFVLGHPGVDSMLVGPGTLPHLDAALVAQDARLTPEARARIVAVAQERTGTDARYAR
jgi:aryl-alcohol dehydrogenase-like predicted oxidoreductase